MSLKKVGEVKKDKGFKIWDLIIYGAIALLVAVLFMVTFLTRDTSPLSGVRIYSDNKIVFEYSFESGEYKNLNESAVSVIADNEQTLKIKVFYEDEFNTVVIDKAGSVKVTEADCFNKTCIAMKEIKDNSGLIYCSPHRLRIEPYEYVPDNVVPI